MALNVSAKSTFTPAPAGNHPARCYRAVDLGTQESNYQGQLNSSRKVMLSFELPTELHQFSEEKGMEPFTVNKEFTASLGKKANLRAFLESWRGRPFTEEELAKFDLSKLIGQTCLLNVIHKTSAAGNVRAEIVSATRMPKGMDCPAPFNQPVEFSLDPESYNSGDFDGLPEWIRNKIATSPEFKAIDGDHAPASTGEDDMESSDIPF